jgi:hypothetical protein
MVFEGLPAQSTDVPEQGPNWGSKVPHVRPGRICSRHHPGVHLHGHSACGAALAPSSLLGLRLAASSGIQSLTASALCAQVLQLRAESRYGGSESERCAACMVRCKPASKSSAKQQVPLRVQCAWWRGAAAQGWRKQSRPGAGGAWQARRRGRSGLRRLRRCRASPPRAPPSTLWSPATAAPTSTSRTASCALPPQPLGRPSRQPCMAAGHALTAIWQHAPPRTSCILHGHQAKAPIAA